MTVPTDKRPFAYDADTEQSLHEAIRAWSVSHEELEASDLVTYLFNVTCKLMYAMSSNSGTAHTTLHEAVDLAHELYGHYAPSTPPQ